MCYKDFPPNPGKVGEYIISTTAPIATTDNLAIRWNSKSGTTVCRKFNSNTTGLSSTNGVDILSSAITAITFTGTTGNVVEWELM